MSYLLLGIFGTPDEPTASTQSPFADGNEILSPAEAMYSIKLQFHNRVETEKKEQTILKQLIQRLQRDLTLLQPQVGLFKKPATSKHTSQTKL